MGADHDEATLREDEDTPPFKYGRGHRIRRGRKKEGGEITLMGYPANHYWYEVNQFSSRKNRVRLFGRWYRTGSKDDDNRRVLIKTRHGPF